MIHERATDSEVREHSRPFEPDIRDRTCRRARANFGFGARGAGVAAPRPRWYRRAQRGADSQTGGDMRALRWWVLTLTVLVAAAAAHGAEAVKIRASWIVAPSDWTPLLPEKPELMKNNGKSYVFEPMRFQGTPAVITALANNEIELGNLAFSSLPLAIENAGLEDLRIVGDQFKDGTEGHYSNQFFVLRDSPIQKVEDLKGKIVATNAAGSAVDIAMRAMLTQKKADLASFVAPFSFDPELKQIGRPLFSQRDALGPTQMIVWVARAGFLQKNRAAMVDFLEDSVRVVRWYLDPKNHDEAVQIAARVTKLRPELFAGWLFTNKEYARSPDLLPDLAALQSNIDVQRDLGFLKTPIDVQKYADLSVVREAAQRLK